MSPSIILRQAAWGILAVGLASCGAKSGGAAKATEASSSSQGQVQNQNCLSQECRTWGALTSGIQGKAMQPPGCGTIPVEPMPGVCEPQPVAEHFVVRIGDKELVKFDSDEKGQFEVLLPPGTYIIEKWNDPEKTTGEMEFLEFQPVEIKVTDGHLTEVDLNFQFLIPPM